jgi:two-component system sensor histidine kinase AgrC
MRLDIMGINIVFAAVSAILLVVYLKLNIISFNKNKVIAFIVTFGILNGVLSTKIASMGIAINTIKPILLVVCSILLIKLFLGLKLLKSVVVFLLLFVGMGIGNSLGFIILTPFIEGSAVEEITSNAFLYIVSNSIVALSTIIFLYLIKPMSRIIKQILSNKEFAFALIFTLIIIAANSGFHYAIKVFNFTAFLIMTIMSVIYCAYAIFNSTVIYKRQTEKVEKEQQEFYNASLEKSIFNLRRFKHDWTNNLQVINSMLEMNKPQEARTYLHEIMEYNAVNNNTSLLNIKNAGLFGIISSKQGLAEDKGLGIEISGVGEIKQIPKIKISELCEIVGIFLDNAIEESEKIKENIGLNYIETEDTIEIGIKNKCKNEVNLINMNSSKGEGRGNGLKIVEQIISKYKNIKNYRSFEAGEFEQLLVIEKV